MRTYWTVWLAEKGSGPWVCSWCKEPVISLGGGTSQDGVIHHIDEDHNNNDIANLQAMHHACHVSHHLTDKPGRVQGQKRTQEQRQRMSEVWKTRGPVSDEARHNMSEAHKGKKASDETKRKQSLAMKGHSWSEETLRRRSESMRGKQPQKISCLQCGMEVTRQLMPRHMRKYHEGGSW
jgi:NUMOD3 motif